MNHREEASVSGPAQIGRRRWLRIFIAGIIAIAVIWNALWFMNYQSYAKYADGYEDYKRQIKGKKADAYDYTIKCPSWPQFVGNYAIGKDNLSVFVWPSLLNQRHDEIGIEIIDKRAKTSYQFYVDKQLSFDDRAHADISPEARAELVKMLSDNKAELKTLYELAKEEWSFH